MTADRKGLTVTAIDQRNVCVCDLTKRSSVPKAFDDLGSPPLPLPLPQPSVFPPYKHMTPAGIGSLLGLDLSGYGAKLV